MTHPELVAEAARWLEKQRCSVVITEVVTTGETPDALGWHGAHSTLVECKASVSDFRADAKKYFRRCPKLGMGITRYFLACQGVIPVDELPAKWGLLEVTPNAGGIRVTRKSGVFYANRRQEAGVLLSCLRRIGHGAPPGVSIRCYTIQTNCTATLGIERL